MDGMNLMKLIFVLLCQMMALSSADEACLLRCRPFGGEESLCITAELKCNDFPDCTDGEDEEGCVGCPGFTCANRWCVESFERCDGHANCMDKSDESNCTRVDYKERHPALPEAELCKKPCGRRGSCSFAPNETAVCDCDYGVSGEFCETTIIVPFRRLQEQKTSNATKETFACDNSRKPRTSYCDGRPDCLDRSDESNCTLADYRTAKPHLDETLLCLMRCRRGKCQFDETLKAHCMCPGNEGGTFCDQTETHGKSAKVSSDFGTIIALAVVAICGVAVIL